MSGKRITDFYITLHGVEHAQYFRGHGVALTRWEDCATGCGESEATALDDALDDLSQAGWDVDALENSAAWQRETKGLSADIPKAIREELEAAGEYGETELYVYVSVDVKGEG